MTLCYPSLTTRLIFCFVHSTTSNRFDLNISMPGWACLAWVGLGQVLPGMDLLGRRVPEHRFVATRRTMIAGAQLYTSIIGCQLFPDYSVYRVTFSVDTDSLPTAICEYLYRKRTPGVIVKTEEARLPRASQMLRRRLVSCQKRSRPQRVIR